MQTIQVGGFGRRCWRFSGCTACVGSGRLFGATPQCAWNGEIKKEYCCSSTPDSNGREIYFFSLRTPLNGPPSILLSMKRPVSVSLLTQRPVLGFWTWLRCLTAPLRWPSPAGGLVAISFGLYACSFSGIVRTCPGPSGLTSDWAIRCIKRKAIFYVFSYSEPGILSCLWWSSECDKVGPNSQ